MEDTYRGFHLMTRLLKPEPGTLPKRRARSVAHRGGITIETVVPFEGNEHRSTRAEIDRLLRPESLRNVENLN